MPLALPRAIFAPARSAMDPVATKSASQAYPLLPSLNVKAQLASCVAMTRAFVAKTLPRSKPLPLPLPMESAVESSSVRTDNSARICELVVIAVRRVVRVDRRGCTEAALATRARSASYWKGSFRRLEQRQRVQCSVRYGDSRKQSRASDSTSGIFDVNEKFVFARLDGAPVYDEAVIEITAPQPPAPHEQPETLARLVIDMDQEFLDTVGVPDAPLQRSCAVNAADGSGTVWEVELVLHRLPIDDAAAQTAAAALAQSLCGVNDGADLEAFGAALPHLWYMC